MYTKKEKPPVASRRRNRKRSSIIAIDEKHRRYKRLLAEKIGDVVSQHSPEILVSAQDAVLALLREGFQSHRAPPDPSIDELVRDARRTNSHLILLCDPVAIDAGELARKSQRKVLTLRSAGGEQ